MNREEKRVKNQKTHRNDTIYSRIFDVFNVVFLIFCAAITIIPLIYVVACSFATEQEIFDSPFCSAGIL